MDRPHIYGVLFKTESLLQEPSFFENLLFLTQIPILLLQKTNTYSIIKDILRIPDRESR